MDIQEYYQNPTTINGLRNFFSGCDWFLTSGSHYSRDPNWGTAPRVRVFPISELEQHLGQGPDIYRPLISRDGVLGVFDIEYFHWDKKTLFLPKDDKQFGVHDQIFQEQLEPIYQYVSETFSDECIIDLTWSGFHVLTDILHNTSVYDALLSLGQNKRQDGTPQCLEHSLLAQYSYCDQNDLKRRHPISTEDAIVYHQFGRVLEFLSHKIIQDVKPKVNLDITISDTQEEGLSLDLSQYGDPIYMRIIRTAFSSWDKHNIIESLSNIVQQPPFVDVIRKYGCLENNDLEYLFPLHQDYSASIEHNKQFNGTILTAGKNVLKLIQEYKQSALRAFHLEFDSKEHDANDHMYKLAKFNPHLDFDIREMMEYPNPSLLQPGKIKRTVEHLLKKSWHPKHIGGMLAGRYEAKDKNWDEVYWSKYNSRTRANFWARIYGGLASVNHQK